LAERIFRVGAVEARLEPGAHPHAAASRPAIDAHWNRRRAENPSLYNGETVLATGWELSPAGVSLACRKIDFATLVHWLDFHSGPEPTLVAGGPIHFFANAVVTGSDGSILVGRQAAHTFNAGKVYMPSGSFEPQDFVGGLADFHANMAREVGEETGLDLDAAEAEAGYTVFESSMLLAIFRVYRFDEPGAALVEQTARHLATAGDGELTELMALAPGQVVAGMPRHVAAYMASG